MEATPHQQAMEIDDSLYRYDHIPLDLTHIQTCNYMYMYMWIFVCTPIMTSLRAQSVITYPCMIADRYARDTNPVHPIGYNKEVETMY